MIPSVLCYVRQSVDLLGPVIPQFLSHIDAAILTTLKFLIIKGVQYV